MRGLSACGSKVTQGWYEEKDEPLVNGNTFNESPGGCGRKNKLKERDDPGKYHERGRDGQAERSISELERNE
jgi:hypothetical protein